MNRPYSNYWWIYLVRGIFAILFGLTTLVLPTPAFGTLVIFFGTFMIADGTFSIMFSINGQRPIKSKHWLFFIGITGIIAGVLILFNPFISAITVVCFFGFWSFFAGIREMIKAVSLREEKKKEAWYVTSGILSILIAVLLLINPLSDVVNLAIIFGLYALLIGISLVSLGIQMRKQTEEYESTPGREGNMIVESSI